MTHTITRRPKKIIIVTSELVPFYYGGIGTQFKSLNALLQRNGNHVSFLARKPENYDANIYRSHYGETPVYFVDTPPIRTGVSPHFIYAAEVARRFDEIYSEIRPDLVIFADFNAEGFFLLLRSGSGAYEDTEFLLTTQGMNFEVISVREGSGLGASASIMGNPDIRLLLAMEDLCIHLAPRIVSLSVCAWEEVRQRLGIRKNARVIPNLVDPDLFNPDGSDSQKEKREPLILFVGRLDRMKGTDLLLKAYFKIAEQMYPAIPRIIFIGRDCYWNEYGSTFLEFWKSRIPDKYAGAISFLGQVSHDTIRNYLKEASVAVFPSRWEPFGIVCLEALSMGCPVVVSRGTGLEEVLGPALSEFAIPVSEDIRPLVQKILSLLPIENRNNTAAELHSGYSVLPERLCERALEVFRQAESEWLDILEDIDREKKAEETSLRQLCRPLHVILASLQELSWKDVTHLQVYFRRQGDYTESDSLRVSYSRLSWVTLKIPFSRGTGERPLRLDPSDNPGKILIREIVLFNQDGNEIWRADGTNNYHGCSYGGNNSWSFSKDCLVIEATTDDPQIFLDCPVTDRSVEMQIILYATDDVCPFPLPPMQVEN